MKFSDYLDILQDDLKGRYETELGVLRRVATPVFDETYSCIESGNLARPILVIEWFNCLGEHYPVLRVDLEGQSVQWFTFNCHKCQDPDDDGSEYEEREFDLWATEAWDYVNHRLEELRLRREDQC